MLTSYMDYTSPGTQFTADVNKSPLFKKDDRNFINVLSVQQLNTLENTSLLDIFLSKSNVVEPHYHQNAAELVYCICGSAVVSLINPFTNELLHFPITPGQVANVPQGWWHYEVATMDDTHLLAIFDAPIPEVILGSDILKLTPTNVLAHTYCLDEAKVKDALAPIQKKTFIGPPVGCVKGAVKGKMENAMPNLQPHGQSPYGAIPQQYGQSPQPQWNAPQQGWAQTPQPYAQAPQPYGQPVYTHQVYGQSNRQQPYAQQQPNVQYAGAPESF
ncbi:cupin domain-containing protein [Paenibacillus sp. NPDC056722]|uniref:cupin domain-containing protein n=1 Tax=Paenibacillus sp. NPDC056722 TaxID=3345924 RepID=UPI00368EDEE3